MAQKAMNPEPGRVMDTRGVATTAGADVTMRKTGYRPDAQFTPTDNPQDPNSLIRVTNDPRLT